MQLANLYWAAEGRTMTADDIHTHLGDDAIPEVRLDRVAYLLSVLRICYVYPGSRILIFVHPGSWISDPGSKKGVKKISSSVFVATKITKL